MEHSIIGYGANWGASHFVELKPSKGLPDRKVRGGSSGNLGSGAMEQSAERKTMLTNYQENKLSSDENVVDVLHTNEDKFSSIPALGTAITGLDSVILQIKVKAGEKDDATAGKTEAKNRAETALINGLMMVCGSLAGLAIEKGDDELLEKVSISRSGFERMRDRDLAIKGKSILDLAGSMAADLTERGVPAEKLSGLNQRLVDYNSALGAQGSSIAQRKGASKSVEDLFKEADTLLQVTIDGLMEHMREDYPQFYAEYHSARQIKDLGIRHNSAPETSEQPAEA